MAAEGISGVANYLVFIKSRMIFPNLMRDGILEIGVFMPSPDNVTVARTFHEAWAERNLDRGAAVIAGYNWPRL